LYCCAATAAALGLNDDEGLGVPPNLALIIVFCEGFAVDLLVLARLRVASSGLDDDCGLGLLIVALS
jgi:hypothetical protein